MRAEDLHVLIEGEALVMNFKDSTAYAGEAVAARRVCGARERSVR